jgi:heterodisulfide reductase subunit C
VEEAVVFVQTGDPSWQVPTCGHCGGCHAGACPRVKSIEYNPDGTVRKVEYHDPAAVYGYGPPPVKTKW